MIDSFNNIAVKDLVEAGTVEASITFTEEELEDIYTKMVELNVMDDLEIPKEPDCHIEPPSQSIWEVQMNNESNAFSYSGYCGTYPEIVIQLINLERHIESIVAQKEEYKELPDIVGSYE